MHDPNKRTHPADGLYLLTARMLQGEICDTQYNYFTATFGDQVLVTLEAVDQAFTMFRAISPKSEGPHLSIFAGVLLRRYKITLREFREFESRYWGAYHDKTEQARAFMDMLYARAKREDHPALKR